MSRIEKAIEIDAPIAECYRALTHIEDFPHCVEGLNSVKHKGAPNVWNWEIKGPSGKVFHFDIEVDGMKHQNNVLSWHTVRDADIAHSGAITLKSASPNITYLNLVIEFTPNQPTKGEWEGRAGDEVRRMVDTSLQHFKDRVQDRSRAHSSSTLGRADKGTVSQGYAAPGDIPYSI